MDEYRGLNAVRNKMIKDNKQCWFAGLAREVEHHLAANDTRAAFRIIRQLRASPDNHGGPLHDAMSRGLTNDPEKLARWKEWFEALLNKPTITPDPVIVESSHNSAVDSEISIDPPSPTDLKAAMKRIKSGRVAGICDITPELLK